MKTFKLLGRYIKKNWIVLVFTVLLLVFLNFVRSIIPKLTSSFIAFVDNKDVTESEVPSYLYRFYATATNLQGKLAVSSLLIVTIAVFRDIMNIMTDVGVYTVSERTGAAAQVAYFTKVQDLPYSYLNHAETGDLIQRSTQDINRFKRFIRQSLGDMFNSLCKLVIFGTSMLLVNVKFSLIVFIMFPIYFITSYVYFKAQSKDFTLMEEKEGKMTNVLQENLTGIRIVKAFANEEHEIEKFNDSINEYSNVWKRVTKRSSTFWGVSDMLSYFQLLLVFAVAIIFVTTNQIALDEVVVLFLYTDQIIWPVRNLGRTLADFGKTNICCSRILDILDMKDEYDESENEKPEIKGEIEFKDVSFQFADATIPTLSNINLKINPGETVAIIGKTGSGKSTFVNMLNRLLDPTSGKLLLDGNDITKIDKKWVRQNVGIILQEPFLYSRTIEKNIDIALTKDDENKAKELAHVAAVDNDIESFDLKYQTMVGERGVTLSGGQKQRISIARMLATKHSILIFDDSLSAVDTETDLKIRKALKESSKQTTTIIITHRIVTAKDADKIVVFEDGKISAIGTHDQLIKKQGLYQTIWKIQNYFVDNPESKGDLNV